MQIHKIIIPLLAIILIAASVFLILQTHAQEPQQPDLDQGHISQDKSKNIAGDEQISSEKTLHLPEHADKHGHSANVGSERAHIQLHKGRIIVPKDESKLHPQVRSVLEAQRTGKFPERLSDMFGPTPFNAEEYRTNPEIFLSVVEPARCQLSAIPGKDVPRIQMLSPSSVGCKTGEVVPLRVKVIPGAPVSFTAFDGFVFKETGLNAITVAADAGGIAEVHAFANAGTVGDAKIRCACPLTAGSISFLLHVMTPDEIAQMKKYKK
ncbi:MAG: hypothetical protein HRU15_06095, partial [Planctomycetes bacterium]|nr:hypothetical protein [Planctomycetota bacterium]